MRSSHVTGEVISGQIEADLLSALRSETGSDHKRLEHALGLLRRPLDRQRFLLLLSRFYGFHVAWEKAIAALPAAGSFYESRSKLPHLEHDLSNLGMNDIDIGALHVCSEAAVLASSEDVAVGSIYVMEGSTLGGQVISKAIARESWVPRGGLVFFNPYGERTQPAWHDFRVWCTERAPRVDWAASVQGARMTFAVLQDWLVK